MFRSKAERKVAEAGYDPARLPPGQYLTEKWPVLHAGDVPSYAADLTGWDFRVYGEVETPLTLTWPELNELPQETMTQDIHCVTRWSRFDATFSGVPWAAIRDLVGQRPSASGSQPAPSIQVSPSGSRSPPARIRRTSSA